MSNFVGIVIYYNCYCFSIFSEVVEYLIFEVNCYVLVIIFLDFGSGIG